MGKDGVNAYRVTTTFTREQHVALDQLAQAKGVKVAWLIRHAVKGFLEQELLKGEASVK